MTSSRLIQRMLRRADKRLTAASSRIDIKPPPPLWGQAEPVWAVLWAWLRHGHAELPMQAAQNLLERAREDFCAALHDLQGDDVHDLLCRAGSARSLRELWHLRSELYRVVACQRSQAEADRRLIRVNQHFPVQATGPALPTPSAPQDDRHEKRTPT